jgi:uncharacterized cupredoxin-like copper-binding protein
MESGAHMKLSRLAAFCLVCGVYGPALAHGPSHTKKETKPVSIEERPFGREGDPGKVSRTIKVGMNDAMRFSPPALQVKRGETIRFEITNAGKMMHEMVLGTMAQLKEHAELMRKHPAMEHDEPYMAHVQPGKKQTLVWQFTQPGEFYYACLIPGHFEAGMIGKVTVAPATR